MKKVLSILCLSLFMMSMTPSSILNKEVQQQDCIEDTFDVMEMTSDLGFDNDIVTCVANMFYAECTGYVVNYDDCF